MLNVELHFFESLWLRPHLAKKVIFSSYPVKYLSFFLRYYDILEDRVPAGLVAEYHALLSRCTEKFQEFSSLRNVLSSDSDCELDNVSMVEGLRLYDQIETLKRKLRIIENPLLRLDICLYIYIFQMRNQDIVLVRVYLTTLHNIY